MLQAGSLLFPPSNVSPHAPNQVHLPSPGRLPSDSEVPLGAPKTSILRIAFQHRFNIDFLMILEAKIDPKSMINQPRIHHACKFAFHFVLTSISYHFSVQQGSYQTIKIIENRMVFQ